MTIFQQTMRPVLCPTYISTNQITSFVTLTIHKSHLINIIGQFKDLRLPSSIHLGEAAKTCGDHVNNQLTILNTIGKEFRQCLGRRDVDTPRHTQNKNSS